MASCRGAPCGRPGGHEGRPYDAVGVGAARKFFIAYHSNW
jgi:hypothetical protein